MDDIVGRLQSAFPSHQLDVIIGSLLGDARLECRSKGIRASYTARLRVHHGEKQKDYVNWKYQTLKDLELYTKSSTKVVRKSSQKRFYQSSLMRCLQFGLWMMGQIMAIT